MLAATWGSVVGSVDGADPDEVAVGVGDHEGAAEHVVVRFLDDVYALRDPLSVGVIDRRGRPGTMSPISLVRGVSRVVSPLRPVQMANSTPGVTSKAT